MAQRTWADIVAATDNQPTVLTGNLSQWDNPGLSAHSSPETILAREARRLGHIIRRIDNIDLPAGLEWAQLMVVKQQLQAIKYEMEAYK